MVCGSNSLSLYSKGLPSLDHRRRIRSSRWSTGSTTHLPSVLVSHRSTSPDPVLVSVTVSRPTRVKVTVGEEPVKEVCGRMITVRQRVPGTFSAVVVFRYQEFLSSRHVRHLNLDGVDTFTVSLLRLKYSRVQTTLVRSDKIFTNVEERTPFRVEYPRRTGSRVRER